MVRRSSPSRNLEVVLVRAAGAGAEGMVKAGRAGAAAARLRGSSRAKRLVRAAAGAGEYAVGWRGKVRSMERAFELDESGVGLCE